MIGIISYFPDDKKIKAIRKRNHIAQIRFLVNIFPKEIIYIVSQNYNENDYINYKNIKYIKFDKPIGPAEARNQIFKQFYNSNEECLLLLDNDVYWYDYYDATSLVKDFYYNSSKYDFELLVPLNPRTTPFKKQLYNSDLKDYFTLKKINLGVCPNLMLIKKVNIYQVSFDKDDENAINEDKLFLKDFILKEYRGYSVLNWVKKSPSEDVCSIIETTDTVKSRKWHKKLVDNFERYLNQAYMLKDGSKEFNKLYNKAEDKLLIKRIRPYYIQKEVIPK